MARHSLSFWTYTGCCALIAATAFFYFPRWKKPAAEATIGWDVTGYYVYLPALFIYNDLRKCEFRHAIWQRYQPTPSFEQAYVHEKTGHFVMKYAAGQAVMMAPFFALAHGYALLDGRYPADGFSLPYQFMISLGSLLVAFLGLWFLRKILLRFFDERTAALTLAGVALGTNYLNYTAIDGAMTHNNLFTLYCLLLYATIRFYERPTRGRGLLIGALVGLAALTRPTEILSALIPLLWGVCLSVPKAWQERLLFLLKNRGPVLLALLAAALVGGIQLVYWKYTAGQWFEYSYREEGFSWLHPHVLDATISYRAGWLIYSPLMALALVGFYFFHKKNWPFFGACTVFSVLFMYVTFAWDNWWYGGSLGQRAMIQAYPVLAFPLAACIEWLLGRAWTRYPFYGALALCIAYNGWLTHQAHEGGLLFAGQMTGPYFRKVIGTMDRRAEDQKLLDTDEEFIGVKHDARVLYTNDFEADTLSAAACGWPPLRGARSLCLSAATPFSPVYSAPLETGDAEWVRASALFYCQDKEWTFWQMAQMVVRFYNEDKIVKERMIRVHRQLDAGAVRSVFIDVKCPEETFNRVGVLFWNAGSQRPIAADNLKIESFNAQ